jgi:hypothetical protein
MTLDERMAEIAETLRQLRAEDTRLRVFGAGTHQYRLNPPLPEAEMQAFEAEHGIRLPEDYRLFLRKIGNGGPGPSYGLRTLAAAAQAVAPAAPFPFTPGVAEYPQAVLDQWNDEPFGVLEICDHGCAIYSYLVTNGPQHGTLWDGELTNVEPTELRFLDWYGRWADASLRLVRAERLTERLRVGMTTDEVMQAVPGEWKKSQSSYADITFFQAAGVPAQLELDEHDRVAKITPWPHL